MPTTPVVISNIRDTMVTQTAPTKNWSTNAVMDLRTSSGSNLYALVYFARPVPLGVTVLSATLKVYQAAAFPSATRTVTAKRITSAWNLDRVTYNTMPTVTTTGQAPVTKTGALAVGAEWAFDVAAQVQAVADGAPWWGFRLEINEATLRRFYSSDAATTFRPVMEVSWSDAPDAPTQLAPAGNRAVSVAKPVLRFDFTDVSGDTSLQAIQVQVNATNVWTAPTFDSGVLATTEPQLDLNATAYAGLAVGASTYWRVRVQDGAGLWSGWSAGAQFQRVAKGTLTITNPAVAPNNFVEEPTPPISWTFTGATQTAYQVVITRADAPNQWLWTSGKIAGATTSVTIPASIIAPGVTYRGVVLVWDTVSREATPGDTVHVAQVREFTYNYTATVTPVTALTATAQAPYPWMQLQWTRATAPDSFAIVRTDNVAGVSSITAADLNPADLLVSGTTYRYVDKVANPRRSTSWQVLAIVNGKTSSPNPTANGMTQPVGIWLSDETRNINVQILGRDGHTDVDMTMVEQGENLDVIGASTPVRVTQSLQGYAGHVAGALVDTDVATAQAARQAILELKRFPSRRCYLTLGDMSFLVKAYNISVSPTPNSSIDFDVSFDFFQYGTHLFQAVL